MLVTFLVTFVLTFFLTAVIARALIPKLKSMKLGPQI